MFGYTFFVAKIRKSECKSVCKTKTNPHKSLIYKGLSDKDGGLKRIRTAVRGFADLCLATRPSDQFFRFGLQIYKLFFNLQNLIHFSLNNSQFSCKNCRLEVKIPSKMRKLGAKSGFLIRFLPLYENYLARMCSISKKRVTFAGYLLTN